MGGICIECERAYNRVDSTKRRSQKISANLCFNPDEFRDIYSLLPPGYHADHIIPLRAVDAKTGERLVGGLHFIANLNPMPAQDNIAKGARISRAVYRREWKRQAKIILKLRDDVEAFFSLPGAKRRNAHAWKVCQWIFRGELWRFD